MRIFRIALIAVLAASPALAQTSPPPSQLGVPAAKPKAHSAKAAKPVPVVPAPHNAHAVKPKGKKSTAGVAVGASAAAVGSAAAGAAVATPKNEAPAEAANAPKTEAPATPPPNDPNKGSVTGLVIPRFMSLRFDDVNLRVGPGTRYPIDWVYHRRDLPVEILRELEDWRLVQDQDNVRGWVRAPALSPRRSLAVRETDRTLRANPDDKADPVAILKPGVIGRVRACAATAAWCEIEVSTYRGWLKRTEIYGVYPNEAIGG